MNVFSSSYFASQYLTLRGLMWGGIGLAAFVLLLFIVYLISNWVHK